MKSTKKEPTFKFPKVLGACADRLKELGDKKSKAQKVVDEIGKEESALEQHMIAELEKQEADGVTGRKAKARINKKEVPILKTDEQDKFYAYVKKHSAFHLLQKRLSSTAIREMWDAGKKIPGIDKFIYKSISITKP